MWSYQNINIERSKSVLCLYNNFSYINNKHRFLKIMANYHEGKNQSGPYQELEEFHGPDLNTLSRNSVTRYNDCDNRIDRSMELNPTVIVPDGI